MCRRDLRECGCYQRRRQSRDHDRPEPRRAEELKLLGPAPVDVRIALLEAHDAFAISQRCETKAQQLLLCGVCVAGEFLGDEEVGATWDEGKDAGGDEFIGEDKVRGLQCFEGGGGEKVGMPGAGADKGDFPALAEALVGCQRGDVGWQVVEEGGERVRSDSGELIERPVLADLAQPSHAARLLRARIRGKDEVVETRGLLQGFVFICEGGGLELAAVAAKVCAACAEIGWEGGGDLAFYASGEFTTVARGGDANLERAVRVGGEEGEGAEGGCVDYIDGDAKAPAERGDVCA